MSSAATEIAALNDICPDGQMIYAPRMIDPSDMICALRHMKEKQTL